MYKSIMAVNTAAVGKEIYYCGGKRNILWGGGGVKPPPQFIHIQFVPT